MTSVKCEKISGPPGFGEGPHWDHKNNVLYFVDIPGKICKYDPKTEKYTYAEIDREGHPSIIIPVSGQNNKFLATIKRDICVVTWDGESAKPENIEILATLDKKYGANINDGKVDARGRLWSGTMGESPAANIPSYDNVLYSFGKDRIPKVWDSKIALSNGIGWSPDNKFMYYIDSFTDAVDVFDFDLEEGSIANRRTVINVKKAGIDAAPDGLTVDADGNLWVATFGGKQVINVDPSSGKILRSVPIPAVNVTSVAFGGPNLDELFVTTGRLTTKDEDLKALPDCGCTFRVTGLGVKGMPAESFPL